MPRRTYKPEDIIRLFKQAETLSSQSKQVEEICREFGILDKSYYRWPKEYGGL